MEVVLRFVQGLYFIYYAFSSKHIILGCIYYIRPLKKKRKKKLVIVLFILQIRRGGGFFLFFILELNIQNLARMSKDRHF
jgi:hypothetical protein